jgi:hypothetical protein
MAGESILTVALEQTQQPWDLYLRRSHLPSRADQCLRAAHDAHRLARNCRHQGLRAHYERIADDYIWLASDISARAARRPRNVTYKDIDTSSVAAVRARATRLILARLRMLVITVPGAALLGAFLEVVHFFMTGKP